MSTGGGLPSDADELRKWAAHWAQHWFLDGEGRDRLHIHDIDAGWAFQVEAQDVLGRVAAATTSTPAVLNERSLLALLKRAGLDRGLRALALRVLRAPLADSPVVTPTAPVAIITETPTPSMIEPAMSVAQAIPRGGCVPAAFDPRAFRRWKAEGFAVRSLALTRQLERTVRRSARGDYRAAWRGIADAPPTLVLNGTDVTQPALGALERLLHRSAEWVGAEATAVDRFLEAVKPRTLLLPSDQHRIGRIATQVARSRGVRTVVLQHGLPQSRVGYVPVVADHVAVWSEASRTWFAAQGTPASKLVVTGNPRLDAVVARVRGTAQRSAGQRCELLLALSPTSPPTNERVLRIALDATQITGGTLTVKLHPGWRDWSFVSRVVRSHRASRRTRIAHHEPIYRLLERSDLVLVHGSSVAVESLALGTPVVMVAVGVVSAAAVELQQLDLPTASDGAMVADLVSELASDRGREAYFAKRAAAIEYVVGPRDHLSSRRIAELATEPDPRPP